MKSNAAGQFGKIADMLALLRDDYRTGIPEVLLRAEAQAQTAKIEKSIQIVFLTEMPLSSAGSEGTLLQAAVEKGLQLTPQDVWVGTVEQYLKAPPRSQGALVLLGEGALRALLKAAPDQELSAKSFAELTGNWVTHAGRRMLPTMSLADVTAQPDGKRRFWNDLKKLLNGA